MTRAQRMHACFALAMSLFVVLAAARQAAAQDRRKPPPTHANVRYASHEQNVFDFWQAESTEPTPLVLFIHGGGFRAGSKDSINAAALRAFLEARISVAAVEYRFVQHAPLPAAHGDCRRALQFLRSKADEWNLDATRVGAYGGSAGAQLCMWLAFHDDMAKPDSADPLERESTRLTAVATTGGQTTMNVAWWQENIPGYEAPHRDFFETFGVDNQQDYELRVADVSALDLISEDDPPIFMSYSMAPDAEAPAEPDANGWRVHHVNFGVALKEKMDALGIEAHFRYPGATTEYGSVEDFLIDKLSQ